MKHLENLMQKEMTRKEFLATIGLGLASIFGLSAMLKMVFDRGQQQSNVQSGSGGYGSSAYGG